MSPALVVLVLAMLLGIQPVTTDLYLPALPALTESFGATVSQAQLTLTTLLLAFGTSLANDVWFWSTCIALASFTLVQRYGEPRG